MSEEKNDKQITLKEFIKNYHDFAISFSDQSKPNVFLSEENKFPTGKENKIVSLCELAQIDKQFYLYYSPEINTERDLALLYSEFYFLMFNSIYSLANIYDSNKSYLSFDETQPFVGTLKINKNNIKSPLIFPEQANISYKIENNSISLIINIGNNKKLSIENITFTEKKKDKSSYVEIHIPFTNDEVFDLCFEKIIYKDYLSSVFNKSLISLVS